MRRRFRALLLAATLLGAAGAAWAGELRALLIGVSGYPTLPERLRLSGPRNDVLRLKQVLLARGVRDDNIAVLADGVPGAALPTRAGILGALERLGARAGRGDTVVLHFAGHGSQQPDAEAGDGSVLEQTLLPYDVGRWDGDQRSVERALRPRELRAAVDRIAARGAFVWAVFDACHSARLVRGGAPETASRDRDVPPHELGVPASAADGSATRGGAPRSAALPWPGVAPPAQGVAGDAAIFYATQAHEVTPELPLPAGRPDAKVHGLFSFVVAQALERAQTMTYRELSQYVLAEYRARVDARATPLVAGTGLDRFVLDQRGERRLQWPLQVEDGRLAMPAGALSGIVPGTVLALLPDALAGDGAVEGYLAVTRTQIERAELAPVAHAGRPPPATDRLRAGRFLRLVMSPMSFELRIAVDRRGCTRRCAGLEALDRLRRQGVPGVAASWTDDTTTADLVLAQQGEAVVFRTPATDGAGDALPRVAVGDGASAAGVDALAARLATALHLVARARNVMRVAAQILAQAPAVPLVAELQVERVRGGRPETVADGTTPTLRAGQRLSLLLRNGGRVPVDVTVLYFDADHGVSCLFPGRQGETNRIDAGGSVTVGDIEVQTPPAGAETLLVIAVEAQRLAEQRDYAFLQQPALSRLRGGAGGESLDAFADAGFADYVTRGAARPAAPPSATAVRLFPLDVRR